MRILSPKIDRRGWRGLSRRTCSAVAGDCAAAASGVAAGNGTPADLATRRPVEEEGASSGNATGVARPAAAGRGGGALAEERPLEGGRARPPGHVPLDSARRRRRSRPHQNTQPSPDRARPQRRLKRPLASPRHGLRSSATVPATTRSSRARGLDTVARRRPMRETPQTHVPFSGSQVRTQVVTSRRDRSF